MPPKLLANSADRRMIERARSAKDMAGTRGALLTLNRKALEAYGYLCRIEALLNYLGEAGALNTTQEVGENSGQSMSEQLATILRDGTVLCTLINQIRPGSIKRINAVKVFAPNASRSVLSRSMSFKAVENILFFLEAFGTIIDECSQQSPRGGQHAQSRYKAFSPTDLFESRNLNKVIDTLVELADIAHKQLNFPVQFSLGELSDYDVDQGEMNMFAKQMEKDKLEEANAPEEEEGRRKEGRVSVAAIVETPQLQKKSTMAPRARRKAVTTIGGPAKPARDRGASLGPVSGTADLTSVVPLQAVHTKLENLESEGASAGGSFLSNSQDASGAEPTLEGATAELAALLEDDRSDSDTPDFGLDDAFDIGDLTDDDLESLERRRVESVGSKSKPVGAAMKSNDTGPTNYAELSRKQTRANKLRWNCDEIMEGLWLGDQDAAEDLDTCKERGITHILCAIGGEPVHPGQFSYLNIDAYDAAGHDILRYFSQTSAFIERARKEGAVLVHCQRGVSRSATLVIAFLMDSLGYNFYDAADFVCEKRPVICPNLGFIKQLQLYEQMGFELAGDTGYHAEYNILRNRSDLIDARDEYFEARGTPGTGVMERFLRSLPFSDSSDETIDCPHCSKPLAAKSDEIVHTGKEQAIHDVIFVVGMEWMHQSIGDTDSGELCCPHESCGKAVGSFDWAEGKGVPSHPVCACGFAAKPAFGFTNSSL